MILGENIQIRASFYPLFKFSVQVVLFAIVGGLIIGAIKYGGDSGLDQAAVLEVMMYVALGIVPFAMILALFLFGVTYFAAVTVNTTEISGRTFCGFKARFPSQSVTEVKVWRNQGISYLRVESDQSHRDITMVLLGVPIGDYATHLSHVLGPEHLLTKWFVENAA